MALLVKLVKLVEVTRLRSTPDSDIKYGKWESTDRQIALAKGNRRAQAVRLVRAVLQCWLSVYPGWCTPGWCMPWCTGPVILAVPDPSSWLYRTRHPGCTALSVIEANALSVTEASALSVMAWLSLADPGMAQSGRSWHGSIWSNLVDLCHC